MLVNKSVLLGGKAAVTALSSSPVRSAATSRLAVMAAEWEKGSMVYKDSMDERESAYLKDTNSNGLISDGPLLTEEAHYLSEAHVDYMYKGPCDSTSSLQLNASTQLMLENAGTLQPMSAHYQTIGGHVPMPANLSGTRLSHLHFKGSATGLSSKFVSSSLIAAHPSRQLHTSAVARQQGIQDLSAPAVDFDQPLPSANTQGVQGDADSAQARLWVSRCLGDGLHTDCDLPPEARGRQRRTIQEVFVQMLTDIRAAAETHLKLQK